MDSLTISSGVVPVHLTGKHTPPLAAVLNRLDRTLDAAEIGAALRQELFARTELDIRLLETAIPNLVAYRAAARLGIPSHRHEPRRLAGRVAPCPRQTMLSLARELLPDWNLDTDHPQPRPA